MITIPNFHVLGCGVPPQIQPREVRWLSYFENPDREQFLFVVTSDRKALLYSGDAGWEKPIEIEVCPGRSVLAPFTVNGADRVRLVVRKDTQKPLLGFSREGDWICACWDASEWARTGKVS